MPTAHSHAIPPRALALAAALTAAAGAAHAEPTVGFGGTVALRSFHGSYLVAEADGRANADRPAVGEWERFRLQDAQGAAPARPLVYGDVVALRSHHGTYLVAEADGRLDANRPAIGGWERFVVQHPTAPGATGAVACGAAIALRTDHGTYVVAEADGRANADRPAIGEWERFTVECQDPPPNLAVRLPIGDTDGVELTFAPGQLAVGADGRLSLSGELGLEVAGLRNTLLDAQIEVTLDGAGRVDTLHGWARVRPGAVGALDGAQFDDLVRGEVGLRHGRDLGHLGVPLRPDTKYLFVELEAGPRVDLGPARVALAAGATFVLDPSDPFLFAGGRLEGLADLTIVESFGVGLSAHGRIPLAAHHTWGLDGLATQMSGHLYLTGRFSLPGLPLAMEGALLVDADAHDDGASIFQGGRDLGLLLNGRADVSVGFGPASAFDLPVVGASVLAQRDGQHASAWFSGALGVDARDLFADLPFELRGHALAAGRLSTDLAQSFVQVGAEVHVAGLDLAQGLARVDAGGVRLEGDLDLELISVRLAGAVGPGHFELSGAGRVDVPVRAPKVVTEWIDVAVQYTANAAVCGWATVTDRNACGTRQVTDAAICGTHTVTNGAICGYTTIASWFCSTFGICEVTPNACEVPSTCDIAATCDVPASCTRWEQRPEERLVPDFDFGDLSADVALRVTNAGLSGSADARFCPTDGACLSLGRSDLQVDGDGLRYCAELPGPGYTCVDL